jgi:predicted phosphodiesterase
VRRATASIQRRGVPKIIITGAVLLLIVLGILATTFNGSVSAWPISGAPGPSLAAFESAGSAGALTRPFTIVALPDTQVYTQYNQIQFRRQVEWTLAHAVDENIVFVTHLGDVVDDNVQEQWDNAVYALDPLLRQDRLPFSIIRGNHDDGRWLLRNLPLSLMQSKPWFVAADRYGLCQAQTFTVDGISFLHIGLGHKPADDELAWANDLLQEPALQGMPVIISAHGYLNSGGGRSSTGQRIWKALVKNNPQVFMVLSGHDAGEAAQVSRNAAGRPVFEMVADYQKRSFGGNGLMRLITIDPVKGTISVKTFSPYFERKDGSTDTAYYETDRNSQFQFSGAWSSGLGLAYGLDEANGSEFVHKLLVAAR